jgi:hypothetical protein
MKHDEILVGMKEISGYMKVSERVVRRYVERYPDIPIKKDGQWVSHAQELSEWFRRHVGSR